MADSNQFYSVSETAKLLKISRSRVLRFCEANDLPRLRDCFILNEIHMDLLEAELSESDDESEDDEHDDAEQDDEPDELDVDE